MALRSARLHAPVALLGVLWLTLGCQDVRDYAGRWSGPGVGDDPLVRQGFAAEVTATLDIERIDLEGLEATLSTSDGVFDDAVVRPLPAARADVLGSLHFDGSPVEVFLCLVEAADGGGDATVFVSLHGDDRVEIRAMRGGDIPLYGIFALSD